MDMERMRALAMEHLQGGVVPKDCTYSHYASHNVEFGGRAPHPVWADDKIVHWLRPGEVAVIVWGDGKRRVPGATWVTFWVDDLLGVTYRQLSLWELAA